MNMINFKKYIVVALATLVAVFALAGGAFATHSWNGYHWARTSNPFTLKLGNNTSGTWTNLLNTASFNWSQSPAILNTTVVAGGTTPKSCRPTSGRVEVCNSSYGNTGWLGIAQIWLTGGTHITKGTVKNNDYYFNAASTYPYKNEAEKLHVICQEIGHTFGLDHQSTDGSSLNTCMDYYHNTSDADLLSTKPNSHDYGELGIIYAHLDAFTTVSTSKSRPFSNGNQANTNLDNPSDWGKRIRTDSHGRESLYERDLGNGEKIFTFVIWADQGAPGFVPNQHESAGR